MTLEFVNRTDLDFLLNDVLDVASLLDADRYAEHDMESVNAIMDLATDMAQEYFLPCASKLDANEPVFVDGKVSIIPEVGEALRVYAESGFFGARFPTDIGGLQLPEVVINAVDGIFSCANPSISAYSMLTSAAANLINAYGTDSQKQTFLPSMLAGEWFGTMCLSEPQAGSSLADIKTKALPVEGGEHYQIKGTKMWISGGDHELSDNIVHLVLAKIPGGGPGVKGISLFIVPKYRADDNGE